MTYKIGQEFPVGSIGCNKSLKIFVKYLLDPLKIGSTNIGLPTGCFNQWHCIVTVNSNFNTLVHEVLLTPISEERGALKLLSQRNLGMKLASYLCTPKTSIKQQNKFQNMYCFKMVANRAYCKSGYFRACNFSRFSDFWHFRLFLNSRFSAILHRPTHKINSFACF